MLKNAKGQVVQPRRRGMNHVEDGFVVSHKTDKGFLTPLRESYLFLTPKCGKMFSIEARAHGMV